MNGFADGRDAAWEPADLSVVGTSDTGGATTAATTLYIVPLCGPEADASHSGSTLVWIGSDVVSAVRVWSAGLHLGAVVQGQITVPAAPTLDPVLARDLAAMYDGVDAARSAWYRTAERVRWR
jgi:hypothetical protein